LPTRIRTLNIPMRKFLILITFSSRPGPAHNGVHARELRKGSLRTLLNFKCAFLLPQVKWE
jgi:hypothetical protein